MIQCYGTGRPTKDVSASYTADGLAIAHFTIASDRRKKGEADFISCVAFGKTAEVMAKYCRKGGKIVISGHIQTGSYDGKNGKVYTTDIVVDNFEFFDAKPAEKEDDFISVPDGAELPFE